VTEPHHARANRLSPVLAVAVLVGSAVAFAYVVLAALAPLG
jgi:uncharacterized membrane protein